MTTIGIMFRNGSGGVRLVCLAASALFALIVLALSSGGGPAVVCGIALALCGVVWARS